MAENLIPVQILPSFSDHTWPYYEDHQRLHKEILEEERQEGVITLSVTSDLIFASGDDRLRAGFGGQATIPVTDNGKLNLGIHYTNFPWDNDKLWSGHRFELFIDLPQSVDWGRLQGGIYGEVTSLTSADRFDDEGHFGVFGGAQYDFLKVKDFLTLSLDARAGLGAGWPNLKQTFLLLGAVIGFDL